LENDTLQDDTSMKLQGIAFWNQTHSLNNQTDFFFFERHRLLAGDDCSKSDNTTCLKKINPSFIDCPTHATDYCPMEQLFGCCPCTCNSKCFACKDGKSCVKKTIPDVCDKPN